MRWVSLSAQLEARDNLSAWRGGIRAASTAPRLGILRSIRQGAHDGLGLLADDREQNARGAVRLPAPLFPGMNCGHVEAEGARKSSLRQTELAAQLGHVHAFGNPYGVTRQGQLAARVRECLIEFLRSGGGPWCYACASSAATSPRISSFSALVKSSFALLAYTSSK